MRLLIAQSAQKALPILQHEQPEAVQRISSSRAYQYFLCCPIAAELRGMGDLSKEEEEPYADNTATGSLVAVYPLSKVKTVFFIRHGQAAHNLAFESIGEAAYLSWENEDSRYERILPAVVYHVTSHACLCLDAG